MKKIVSCLLLTSCFSLVGGCSGSSNAQNPAVTEVKTVETAPTDDFTASGLSARSTATAAYIGEEKAKVIALEHAGLSEPEVNFVKTKLDHDDGRSVYDVEFYSGSKEYDYEIDAYTGEVRSFDFDVENNTIMFDNNAVSSEYIDAGTAKAAALKHAGLSEDQVTFIKVRLDREDHKAAYDIEFYSGNTEYDYEVDAYSGTVISCDFDIENYLIASSGTTNAVPNDKEEYISSEEAKRIALDKAGRSEAEAQFKEVSFDYEDGVAVYQIEFISAGMEYEMEINAVSGMVAEYSVESQYD